MGIFNGIKSIFQRPGFENIRIEKIKPFQAELEIKTDTVWFEEHNIEDCIKATQNLGIEHIHLQTTNIDFLTDPRLQNIKGVAMQFEVFDITPLFSLRNLTHLHLPENINTEIDFSKFKNLIFLGNSVPKKYINFKALSSLKFARIFDYRKSDLNDFAEFEYLQKLEVYSASIENLNGLSKLENLIQIDLENCKRLTSLNGLSDRNVRLKAVHVVNCKNLKNADGLVELPNLRQLQLYKVLQLDSLTFLTSLCKLETLMLHPNKVGVRYNDYYPLVETLKKLNQLDNLKGWKPLKDYLQQKIIIEETEPGGKSELVLIKENLGIMAWVEKSKNGLKQYNLKNCKNAETIILDLIKQLENSKKNNASEKERLIGNCVLELNKFNDSLRGSFIETEEREELCDLFDNIADAVGINVQDYPDGIAGKWRNW